jgi:hypothetical protein
MQGIYVNYRRPASKKAVKEAITAGENVSLEATSMFGNEYDGPVKDAPHGTYLFVGPDPYNKRNFYGKIVISDKGIKVS